MIRPGDGRLLARLMSIGLMLLLWSVSAFAEEGHQLRGVALVVGNGDYEHLSDLANPAKDARAMDDLLIDLGFDTSVSSDRDGKRLKRDIERFAEDAEGADVAILYYSGHGIEAGGENYLVPVDGDASSLENAAQSLVPLSAVLDKLTTTVPIVVVMLDACRNNPFPPGAVLHPSVGAPALPMTAAGLGKPRGARPLSKTAASGSEDSVATVIAFAAEPGSVAMDGAPGANSPFAAALLKHFGAVDASLSDIMTLVTEEVYLKTQARQRPWVNASLRRLLYFGQTVPEPEGPEGEILKERRSLLLTIAALPSVGRRQIESVAAEGGVPMDALYGMLRALGEEAPADPGRLDAMLRAQSERLREIMAERAALTQDDPTILRLTSLAGQAIEEGALTTAIGLHQQAKVRVAELSARLDDVETQLREQRIQFARVYADSAAAYELAFDFDAAAADYERAFAEVERWDDGLAWDYRRKAIVAEYRHGEYSGDAAALERILARRDETLRLAARLPSELPRGEALLQLGNAQNILGKQRSDATLLGSAIADYQEAISVFEAGGDHFSLARARNNLAGALASLGAHDGETVRLEQAVSIYRELAAAAPFDAHSHEWITARLNLASTLSRLGERSKDTTVMREAMNILSETATKSGPEVGPIPWALVRFNLAGTMLFVGEREGNPKMLADSVKAGQEVLEVFTREAFPLYWASVHNNVGNAYQALGFGLDDPTFFRAAEYEYRDALEEWRQERVPNDWAMATNNLANVLKKLGDKQDELARLDEAVRLYEACMKVWTRADKPLSWASAQNNLGDALAILGGKRNDVAALRKAIAAFDLALTEWTRERVPYDWAVATNNRGGALVALGTLTASTEEIRRGMTDIEAAWAHDKASGVSDYDDYYRKRVDAAREALARLGG